MTDKVSRRTFIGAAGVGAAAVAVAGPEMFMVEAAGKPAIRIASKGFTEVNIAGWLYALVLQHHGMKVDTSHFAPQTAVQVNQAMIHGDIDLYAEYTGTGLFDILNYKKLPSHDPHKIWLIVNQKFRKKWNIVWLDPAPMNDSNAFAVTPKTASKYHLKTLSDLARQSHNLSIAVLAECTTRNDCLLGLQRGYHAKFKSVSAPGGQGVLYQQIEQGAVDVIQVFSTDGQIPEFHLKVMTDNKRFFPPYQLAPVARGHILKTYPKMTNYLNQIHNYLTTKAFQKMNYEAAAQGKKEEDIARAFLKKHHLI